ncbi:MULTISPECIES: GAF and ANTAR domain-containing protein [Cryobacterium]|uniref:ANTAR domain-containing protein n=1 Tax=Cryobacterium glucosi TaxID=1259175 RepID=A0ABY2IUM3_9MICO|nr:MULTISPECIES: GAF and ANTAR domain-containing protein [Cryobacterium]MDY7528255.1 GAF and ANTAR domain-containing protein [Cryobacterium sp. 10C2]MDY7555998.1 GAF and ANTAR domain-containing protein [Cryobacterium sp. 10C3]MEB0003976.1 GAF and ANTAR domain-containing protein [Cryobacterium sp. RTC2.1]MEB0290490.1 GAF and ANTAR domain-containing protein [Cryobacterium sp. 10C2]TFB96374.1 ANTAR domain-containing protein [Cryobacterium sp. MDB2-A-1]
MIDSTREDRLIDTFATLADTLVADYDVVDLLQTLVESCADLFDISAAGILLADADGELEVIASTSEASRLVEVMQLSARAGPCVESFTTGSVVSLPDVEDSPPEWQRFRDSAREQGFAAVFAIPLRLRETTIGALNLLSSVPGALPPRDVRAAQALADVATIGILQERTLRESMSVREQLTNALTSRVVIEQAKGVLAHSRGISMEEAFILLRTYARTNRLLLSRVAQGLVDQTLVI